MSTARLRHGLGRVFLAVYVGALAGSFTYRFVSLLAGSESRRVEEAVLLGTLASAAAAAAAAAAGGGGLLNCEQRRGAVVWRWFAVVAAASFAALPGVAVFSTAAVYASGEGAGAEAAAKTAVEVSVMLLMLASAGAVPVGAAAAACTVPVALAVRGACCHGGLPGGPDAPRVDRGLWSAAAAILRVAAVAAICLWLGAFRAPYLLGRAGYALWCSERPLGTAVSPDGRHVARAIAWDCGGATTSYTTSVMVGRNAHWPLRAASAVVGVGDDGEVLRGEWSRSTGLFWEDSATLRIVYTGAWGHRRETPWNGIRLVYAEAS